MNTHLNAEFVLADLSARSIHVRKRPLEIVCVDGELLVTMEGDPEDHVLAPGSAFRATGRGRLVVMALGDARVRIGEALHAPPAARDPAEDAEPRGAREWAAAR